jgi:OPA family glycerol-3-phosphate transporter-like MFS transporter/OPA family sugar phosphate sensor protein UhpC-like MFS transporter
LSIDSVSDRKPRFYDGLLAIFRPDPPASNIITDPALIESGYSHRRKQVLIASIVGYAMFYFVRKNLSIAMPAINEKLGISKTDLGLFLTLHGVIYGVSKFANGFLGDRCNARVFMAFGLLLSAVMNIFFGMTSLAVLMGIFWMFNGWFQGMGFPPCARLMTHWFSPKELARKMSVWNTSHSIGAGAIMVLCGYLVGYNWRLCFFVPAGLAIACAVYLLFSLPDTPQSAGLPELSDTCEVTTNEVPGKGEEPFVNVLMAKVFTNRYIWIIALANFFVYAIRYALFDWGPTFLKQSKHIELNISGWIFAAFEISGCAGMIASGWITDKVFGGRGSRTCFFYMLCCTGSVFLFWKCAGNSAINNALFLALAGFFIYGPQALVGITVANLATKKAAASAVGLTGIFGYASTTLSGVGIGWLVQRSGWDAGFYAMIISGIIGAALFALAWPAKPHGYNYE